MRNLNITDYQENDIITKEYVDSKLGSTPRSEISSVVFANKKFILGKQALADMINLTNIVKSEYIIKVNDYALANTAIKDFVRSLSCDYIGKHAFENCSQLSGILFGKIPYVIDDYAFKNCQQLKTFVKREYCTYLGEGAFQNCSELTTAIQLNNSINTIKNNTFAGCSKIATFSNFNNISSIGDYAFASCYNFPKQINLPECTEIGRYAFLSCENLSNLTARKCTFVDYNAFYGTKLWDIEPSEV